MKSMLVVSKEADIDRRIQKSVKSAYKVGRAAAKSEALAILEKNRFDFLFIDIDLLSKDLTESGLNNALQQFWEIYPTLEIIVMASQSHIRNAVKAVKAGASNYLTYPFEAEEIDYLIDEIYNQTVIQSELNYLRDHFWQAEFTDVIKTNNERMETVFEKIRSVAPTKSTVLLSGETGTGKSIIANLIHQHSNRKKEPFISLHCGAIPDTLLESELFGHEKGAFTGAIKRKLGKFEIAKNGTIFLDEIGTITPSAQIKLLQIIQDSIFQRVGGEETIRADIRIIAATNSDLRKMRDDGLFRMDLYYRLNVFPVEIPALRERIEDIPILSDIFIKKLNRYYEKDIHGIHGDVIHAFYQYDWPGNIRELENLIERAYILESRSILTPDSFPNELFSKKISEKEHISLASIGTLKDFRQKCIEESEALYLTELMNKHQGKIAESALAAGISTRQLSKLLKKYNIRKADFRPEIYPYMKHI